MSAPRRGRALDRSHLPAALTRPLLVGAVLLGALAAALLLNLPPALSAGLAAITAVAVSGVPGGFRSLLARTWTDRATSRRAFAGDAAITEITWIAGPALTTGVFTLAGPAAPLACAALLWVGSALLAHRVPTSAGTPRSPGRRARTADLIRPLLPLLALNLSIGVNLGSLDVGLPALLHDRGRGAEYGGLLIAALSLSSAGTVLALSAPVANRFLAHHNSRRLAVLTHAGTRTGRICSNCSAVPRPWW